MNRFLRTTHFRNIVISLLFTLSLGVDVDIHISVLFIIFILLNLFLYKVHSWVRIEKGMIMLDHNELIDYLMTNNMSKNEKKFIKIKLDIIYGYFIDGCVGVILGNGKMSSILTILDDSIKMYEKKWYKNPNIDNTMIHDFNKTHNVNINTFIKEIDIILNTNTSTKHKISMLRKKLKKFMILTISDVELIFKDRKNKKNHNIGGINNERVGLVKEMFLNNNMVIPKNLANKMLNIINMDG